jgi:photosystem II stability/assembly factor-like uncharacterized protein
VAASSGNEFGSKPGNIYTSADSGVTWTKHDELLQKWVSLASSADGSRLVAAADGGFIYVSVDSGTTWTPHLAAGTWLGVVSSADGTQVVASGDSLFTSADSGSTWTEQTWPFNWCLPAVRASSADGSKIIAFGVGGHGAGYFFTSSDFGRSWTQRWFADGWSDMASSADGTKLVVVQIHGGIHTSVDSGVTWKQRKDGDWTGVASSADGTKLVAAAGAVFLSSGPTP